MVSEKTVMIIVVYLRLPPEERPLLPEDELLVLPAELLDDELLLGAEYVELLEELDVLEGVEYVLLLRLGVVLRW